jgi:hypothetical protein
MLMFTEIINSFAPLYIIYSKTIFICSTYFLYSFTNTSKKLYLLWKTVSSHEQSRIVTSSFLSVLTTDAVVVEKSCQQESYSK